MVALCALILLATVVAVGSFVNSVHFRNPVGLICTATSDSARELEQPLEILKERSTECNARELNILATRLISRGSSVHHLRNCHDIYEYLSTVCKPDSRTQTALMSAYISHSKFREALVLFDEMRERGGAVDKVAYTNAVRAAGHASSARVTQLLHDALAELGPTRATQVFNAALANLKFLDRSVTVSATEEQTVLDHARELVEWMVRSKMAISSQTMDTYLGVVCTHGDERAVEDALAMREQFDVTATDFTLNILTSYHLASNKSLQEVLTLVRSLSSRWSVRPDAVTINTLLKSCLKSKDAVAADLVLSLMAESEVRPNRWTNELLVEVDGLRGNVSAALDAVEKTSDSELTPHMISAALSVCDNSTVVLRLAQRALALGLADAAVVASAVKKLTAAGEYESAHQILRSLWQRGVQLDKYVISAMLSAVFLECHALLEDGRSTVTSERIRGRVLLLRQYLQTVKATQPELLTSGVCQRVVKELVGFGEHDAACSIHLQLFPRCTVQTDILSSLFQGLQDQCTLSAPVDAEYSVSIAKKSLALFHMYAFSNSTSLSGEGSLEDQKVFPLWLLRSIHVNNVLKMLSTAKLFDFSEKLFHILSHHQFMELTDASAMRLRLGRTLRPTLFTVAELVRTGRASGRIALARDAMLWAVESGTHLPLDLVRDAVSLLYAQGEVGMARALYDRLYGAGRVQHWATDEGAVAQEPIMDLHFFTRGMAYAAINCAIREIREHRTGEPSSSVDSRVTLTIITGRNLPNAHSSDERPAVLAPSDVSEAYRLSSEIQNVLIDDFFPPISSSTVPGNPGRLYITLSL